MHEYVRNVCSVIGPLIKPFVCQAFHCSSRRVLEKKNKCKNPPITFSPAKNGTRMFFVGDHTFFGELVNIAETLQTICWYKVVDVSLYRSRLNMFPLKQQQKSGLSFAQTTITTNVLYQIISLKVYIE